LPGRNAAPRRQSPPRRLTSRRSPVAASPRRRALSRGQAALQSFLSSVVASLLGRSHPPRPRPFPADPRGLRRYRPPALASAGSSSPGLTSSSEFQPLQPARRAHAPSSSHGVPSLHRDIRSRSPLSGSVPSLPMFRPRCFAHPRRLAPPRSLPACFIRLPRPRFPLQGFPPMVSRSSSSLALALVSVAGVHLRESCLARSSSRRPAFRALIQPSIPSSRPVG